MKKTKIKEMLKKLGIVENYYHIGEDGTLYYMFVAPGQEKENFEVSYIGDSVEVKLNDTVIKLRVGVRGMKFDVTKGTAQYHDGTLILSIPAKDSKVGKIEVEA